MLPRRSAAQLDRDIAAVLSKKKKKRSHSKVRPRGTFSKKQADVLMVANDAALSDQYARAVEVLSKGKQRAIATAYKTTTPESAEAGDWADHGWENEEGDDIEVDDGDIEDQHRKGSQAPVTDAIVEAAIKWLRREGVSEASSSSYGPGVWYESGWDTDYRTGEERSEDFFLRNFTEPEEREIFDRIKARRW